MSFLNGALSLTSHAVEPLRLRAWARDLLWIDPERREDRPVAAPPHAKPRSWETFLRGERCASALLRRLEGRELRGTIDGFGLERIKASARREMQRMLSARGQLPGIARVARRHGIEAVVVKGGLWAARRARSGDLVDLDVLVRPEEARDFDRLLEGEGYARAGTQEVEQHLSPLGLPDQVPVEIHTSLQLVEPPALEAMWDRSEPLEGLEGLFGLAAPDHLWYLLLHSGLQHPHRRGSLRDLLLICDVLAECTEEEVAAVARRVAEHPEAGLLEPLLETSRRLVAGERPPDPFREVAAANYLFVGRILPGGLRRTWALPLASLVFDHLEQAGGPGPWAFARAEASSPRTWLSALESSSPRLAGWLTQQLRVGRLVLLEPLSRWIAASARAAVRRSGPSAA